MTEIATKTCTPCSGNMAALKRAEINELRADLCHWAVERDRRLARTFAFPDFAQALAFVNRVAEIAEEQGHHPDLSLAWGRVRVEIWTHKVNGLTESDFILAAKIDDAQTRW